MKNECTNIYKISREAADFNQETAASLLFISTRSLSDYETGKTIPGDDIVCSMVDLYQSPILAYLHLKLNNEVGRRFLPDIRDEELSRAVLRFQKEQNDLQTINPQMVSIACDGEVTDEELSGWEQVREEVWHVAAAAMSILFRKEKRPLQAAQ